MTESLDLLGIGFGPAGIALAAAIEDWVEAHDGERPWTVRFLDRNPSTIWQGELLLPNCNIRHHHFRDMATPRNPRSRFTFANYLMEKDRLFDFCLLSNGVSRIEWSDYITWAAGELSRYVTYDQEVVALEPREENGRVTALEARTAGGERHLARNLILSTGQRPRIPEVFEPHLGERVFHSGRFLSRIGDLDLDAPHRIVLVGAGQSAAEACLYLHGRFRNAAITSVHRSIGFKQTDEAAFSQMAYLPDETDLFFRLSPEQRDHATADVRVTNYSVVDRDVLDALYWTLYEESVQKSRKAPRLRMVNRHRVRGIEARDGAFELDLEHIYLEGESERLEADVVILCTGFIEDDVPHLLEPLKPFLHLDAAGGPAIRRDYRLETDGRFEPAIYLNGLTERTHGLSDSASFSMMALKGETIFRSALGPPLEGAGRPHRAPQDDASDGAADAIGPTASVALA